MIYINNLTYKNTKATKVTILPATPLLHWGRISYVLTFVFAILISVYFGFYNSIITDKWASQWVAIATPLLIFFSIGTALLRHDAKLRQRYEHLSDKKHSLEKASGVLEASKHLSQVENVQENHPLIVSTFNQVASKLLESKNGETKNTTEPQSEAEKALIAAVVAKNLEMKK